MGVTQAAGLSLRWFRDRFGLRGDGAATNREDDPYETLCQEAAQALPGSDGVLWAPYLMGERTPHLDPERAGGTGRSCRKPHSRAHPPRHSRRRGVLAARHADNL